MLELLLQSLLHSYFPLILFFLFIFWLIETNTFVLSHWHHTFDKTNFSTQEFYDTLENSLFERKIPDVTVRRVTHNERIILSSKREYFRINWKGETFDVCAASYGNGMYVSWWFVDRSTRLHRLVMRIPVIKYLNTTKTYHRADLEQMFADLIHLCVLESIDGMTGIAGSTLSETDRAIIRMPHKIQ